MITVANRATPQAPTLEQQETAETREAASAAGQTPALLQPAIQPKAPAKRSTLSLPQTERTVPVEGKARD
jgi:hypothetical protein